MKGASISGLGINNMRREYRILIICGVIISLIIVIIFVINVISHIGKTKITITFAPGDAIIKIDDKEISHKKCTSNNCSKNIYVKNGVRSVNLSMPNFSTVTQAIDTERSQELALLVTPANPTGQKYYDDNQYVQFQIQNSSSQEFTKGSDKITDRYPYLNKLNLYGGGYTVGYGVSSYTKRDPYSIALYIDANNANNRKKAIEAIIDELGVYPYDIEIIYENFNNPFAEIK